MRFFRLALHTNLEIETFSGALHTNLETAYFPYCCFFYKGQVAWNTSVNFHIHTTLQHVRQHLRLTHHLLEDQVLKRLSCRCFDPSFRRMLVCPVVFHANLNARRDRSFLSSKFGRA